MSSPTISNDALVVDGNNKFQAIIHPPVTPTENLKAAVRGEIPWWIPGCDFISFNPNIVPDNICRAFVREVSVPPEKDGLDMFGLEWVYVDVAGGSTVKPGNPVLLDANDWKEVIRFPDIDSWDWAGCAERNKAYLGDGSAPVFMTHFTGMYERLISFMDFENAAVALIDEDQQDAVHELFAALADLHCRMIDKEVEYFHPTGITFHDDWGSQMATFFSRGTYEEMIFPYVRRVVDHAHEKGLIFELHSCGHNDSITDLIAGLGIDMWRPQPMNDMDRVYQVADGRFVMGMMLPKLPPESTQEDWEKLIDGLLERFNVPGHNIYLASRDPAPKVLHGLYESSKRHFDAQAGRV